MRVALLVVMVGCGRFGFDAGSDGSVVIGDDGDGDGDAMMPDALMGGPSGVVMRLDGTSFVSLDSVCAELPGARTVTAWIEPSAVQVASMYSEVFAFNTSTGGANLSLVQYDNDQMLNYYDDFYSNLLQLDRTMPANEWSFVALTIDATGNGVLYRNVVVALTFTTTRMVAANDRLSLGQEWDGTTPTEFFVGRYDEVSVWNVARTASELQDEMMYGVALDDPALVAHYSFGAGTFTDDTGSGHTATPVANVTFEPK